MQIWQLDSLPTFQKQPFQIQQNDHFILHIELVEPTVTRPVQDPLAVELLDNRLYMPPTPSW